MKSATTQMLEKLQGAVDGPGDTADASSPEVEVKRKRILLIEDEPSTRLVLLQKLRSTGFDVDVAVNGKVALEKIRTSHPDAIFMDFLLPRLKGLEGVDVIKAARRDPNFAGRPIYVCTSAALMTLWTRKGTKAGATKVFDRASTPIDAIVAEVAADLLGIGLKAKSPDSTSPGNEKPVTSPANHPAAQTGDKESAPGQQLSFMKRVARTFGLGGKNLQAGDPSSTTASDPVSPVPPPVASEPGGITDLAPDQLSSSDTRPASDLEGFAADAGGGSLEGIDMSTAEHGVAVLTLDENARILSANKTCCGMFGREGAELVGQHLALLLKDGQEQDIEKLVQQQRAADQSKVTSPLLTVARRKDGTEFPVSITTLTWSSDTALVGRAESAQFCWTAFIRDMATVGDSQSHAVATPEPESQPQAGESMVLASEMAELHERFAALQKGNEELQQQLQEISAESALRHEDITKREQERQELAGRIFESEVQLNRARAELEKESEERKQLEQKLQELRTELENQNGERERLESEWREQLRCADVLTRKLEARWLEEAGRSKGLEERLQIFSNSLKMEQAERSKRFEEEVLSLRKERDELYGKLSEEQLATEEFRRRTEELETRLRDSADEVERVKTELEKQTAEQGLLETEWREKLSAAEALTSQLEAAWVHAEEHNKRTEAELASLKEARDELKAKLAGEHEAAAQSGRRNDELANRVMENSAELERVRAELEKAGHNEHFEAQLSGLEQAREELSGELRTGQLASAESGQRIEELENRLRENAAELERVKAEADRHAEEQARFESELQSKLDAASAAAGQAEDALKEKAAQCSQFESQLATLEQLRDELGRKLATEQESAAASKQRSQELESRLQDSTSEMERVKAEHEKQAEEQARLESELREQLDAARTAARQAEAALNEQTEQNKGFEERLQLFGNSIRLEQIESTERLESELTGLQQARDELGSKLTAEQQACAEARRRSEELGNELRETVSELERVKAELSRHAEERARQDSEQGERLNTARAAAEKAEAALIEESERGKRVEQELVELRQQRDQLDQKFSAEQQALTESMRRADELEGRLRETTAELERVHAELARYAEEQSRTESDQRNQIVAGKAATEKAEAAWHEETERSKRLESGLAELRQERDQLQQKFAAEQQAVAESRRHSVDLEDRLSETVAEMARVRAELVRHVEERERLQSGMAEQASQLNAARAAVEKAEAALSEKAALCHRSQEEAASLWRECETISNKLAVEQRKAAEMKRRSEEFEQQLRESAAELERTKASQQQQTEEQKRLEADLREEVNHSRAAAARAEEALKEGAAHQRQLERSLVNLRNERHQVYDKFKSEHAALEKSKRRVSELEKRQRERVTEIERARSELRKQAAENSRQQEEWRAQLETARAMAERELSSQRRDNEALQARLATEQQAAAEFKRHREDFESRLAESGAELERMKAELDQHVREQARLESEQQSFTAINNALGRELQQLRESEAAFKADVVEMEGRLAENVALLARVTTELERERSERQRLEQRASCLNTEMQQLHKELQQHLSTEQANEQRVAGLMQQLGESEAAVTRITMDLQREVVNRQAAEEQLRATAEVGEQLRNHLSLLEEAKEVFATREAELESRLQAGLNALRESESTAQKEIGERRRLEEALQDAQRASQQQSDDNAAELAKLRSAMQVEQLQRKGLQAQAVQSRFTSLDSTRVGAAMVNNFRDRLRQPIDKVMQSARRLLELSLNDEQKKLVETLVESALLLQTTARESGTSNPASLADGRAETPLEPGEVRDVSPASTQAPGNLQP